MRVEVENLPSLRNPCTSHLAALSAVATVRGLLSEFKLGT
jgi:predicted dinucleotide-utilizing enzyme